MLDDKSNTDTIKDSDEIKGRSSLITSTSSPIDQQKQINTYKYILKVIAFLILCAILLSFVVEIKVEDIVESTPEVKDASLRSTPKRHQRTSEEATRAMLNQPSTFVDGEKKLKAELDKLAAYQRQGKYLGAIFKTRWDDNGPIWTTKDGEVVNENSQEKKD